MERQVTKAHSDGGVDLAIDIHDIQYLTGTTLIPDTTTLDDPTAPACPNLSHRALMGQHSGNHPLANSRLVDGH